MKSKKFKDEFKAIIPANVDPIKLADKIKKGMTTRFLKNIKYKRKFEFEPIIPRNVDPIKLADKIKGNLSSAWIKRRSKIKSRLAQRS